MNYEPPSKSFPLANVHRTTELPCGANMSYIIANHQNSTAQAAIRLRLKVEKAFVNPPAQRTCVLRRTRLPLPFNKQGFK
jgi:hypothetical protein